MSVQKNTPNFLKHNGFSFTTVINETLDLIPDDGAFGIYCYLASKSENWEICQVHLQNRFNKGRDYIRKKMDILKKIGLIKTEAIKDDKGKILYWETTLLNHIDSKNIQVTENPYCGEKLSTVQITENPECGKSRRLEKPTLLNKRSLPIKEKAQNKRERLPKARRSALSDNFIFNDKTINVLAQVATKVGIEKETLKAKFIAWAKDSNHQSCDWNASFEKFLLSERPTIKKVEVKAVVNNMGFHTSDWMYDDHGRRIPRATMNG